MNSFSFVLFLSLCVIVMSKVQIYTPLALKDLIRDGEDIPMSIANFGIVPYGHTILGELVRYANLQL